MKIECHKNSMFHAVKIIDGSTTIDLGLLDESERDDLAIELIQAIYAIGPYGQADALEWLCGIFKQCGIELPTDAGDQQKEKEL